MDAKKKKLTIDIHPEHHQRLKIRAAYRNMTIRKYVLQAIMERVLREESVS